MLLEVRDPGLVVAGILYTAVLLILIFGFLINWYRNRQAIAPYKRVGLNLALVVLVFEIAQVALGGISTGALVLTSCVTLVALGWVLIRIWAFVNNGVFFCNQLGIRSFPILSPKLGWPDPRAISIPDTAPNTQPIEVEVGAGSQLVETVQSPSLAQLETQSAPIEPIEPLPVQPEPLDRLRYVRDVLAVGLGAVAYTVVLFWLTSPRPGDVVNNLSGGEASSTVTLFTLVVILEFALVEELMFRLALQNYLAAKFVQRRYGYWLAIILTTSVWTLGHVGSLDPNWVKMVQIFPIGLALGWLFRKHGAESTILAHGLFNVVAAFVATPLYMR